MASAHSATPSGGNPPGGPPTATQPPGPEGAGRRTALSELLRQNWRSAVLCLVLGLLLSQIWTEAAALRTAGEPVSERYSYYAIPIAISEIHFGHRRDYAGYYLAAADFLNEPCRSDSIDRLIARAKNRPRDEVRGSYEWLIPADDKGLVDFVWLAFRLFGDHYSALHCLFYLLFCLGVLAFVLAFFRKTSRLAFGLLVVTSFYVVLFIIPLSDQFGSLVQPRFLDVLSLLPVCHLLFLITDRTPISWYHLPLALVQVGLLVFVLHGRSSAVWQVYSLVLLTAVLLVGSIRNRESSNGIARRVLVRCGVTIVRAWPLPIVLAGVLALQVYKRVTYHPRYFDVQGSQHVVWHNVLMGLSAHPALEKKYQLGFVDDKTALAVEKYLKDHGEETKRRAIFGRPDYMAGNWKQFNWVLYEPCARKLCLEILKRSPIQVAQAVLIYKPWVFCQSVAWMAGLGYRAEATQELGRGVAPDGLRRAQGLYYRPLRWTALGVLLCILLLSYAELREGIKEDLHVAFLAFAFSLLPGMSVLPLIHYIGVPLILLTVLAYLLVLGVACGTGHRLFRWARRSPPAVPRPADCCWLSRPQRGQSR